MICLLCNQKHWEIQTSLTVQHQLVTVKGGRHEGGRPQLGTVEERVRRLRGMERLGPRGLEGLP